MQLVPRGFARPALAAYVVLAACQAQSASLSALDFDPSTTGSDEHLFYTNGMYGWRFSVSQSVTVTGLGWFDQDRDGLTHAHEVGIWQKPGFPELLTSLIIPAGTNARLDGFWREVDLVNSISLPAGYYVVAGTYYSENPDVVKLAPFDISADPRISIGSPAYFEPTVPGQPADPLFQPPNRYLLINGAELGPTLFIETAPTLRLSLVGSQIVLSWPSWATNFVLETSSRLGTASAWFTVTNPVTVSNENFIKTNAVDSEAAFYRLRAAEP
jgi:hypothetical protein